MSEIIFFALLFFLSQFSHFKESNSRDFEILFYLPVYDGLYSFSPCTIKNCAGIRELGLPGFVCFLSQTIRVVLFPSRPGLTSILKILIKEISGYSDRVSSKKGQDDLLRFFL